MRIDIGQKTTVISTRDPLDHTVNFGYKGCVTFALQPHIILLKADKFFCCGLENIFCEPVFFCVVVHPFFYSQSLINSKPVTQTSNMSRVLFNPADGTDISRFDFMAGKYLMNRFQFMVRLLQNHIGGPDKIFVDFTDYSQKLHRTVSDSVILSVSKVSLFKQVKNDIVDFSCNVGNDCFIIIFVADFRRKNFYYKAQIIGSVYPDNQVGHTDFISEINHTG